MTDIPRVHDHVLCWTPASFLEQENIQHKFLLKVNPTRLFYLPTNLIPMFTLKMKKALLFVSGAVALLACTSEKTDERAILANNIEKSITTELLNKWYPDCNG